MATQLAERRENPVAVFRQNLDQMADQLKMALPAHISVEKFQRVATTAVQQNPSLLDPSKVERRSLFGALTKAAQDGLLPDGREGAIVPFKGKAQWMPMVAGIMKKVRNSGEIANWDVAAVFEKDKFQRLLGDDQRIYHEPYDEGDPGEVVGAYSIVTLKDGSKSRDYMSRWRIEKARNQNPMGKNSLMWTQFFDEGAIKTVIRHHSKRLPMSTDIEAVFERDDTMQIERSATMMLAANNSEEPQAPASRLDALEHHIEQDEISTATGTTAEAEGQPEDGEVVAPSSDHEGRGETPSLDEARAAVDRAELVADVNAVVRSYEGQLGEGDFDALRSHAMGRIEAMKEGAK